MIREIHIRDFQPQETDTIWDVRDDKAYLAGHIQYAVNQPLDRLNPTLLSQTTGTIYVLCGGGNKAIRASQLLNEFDDSRDIVILTGGTRGAKAAGMTIITGNDDD